MAIMYEVEGTQPITLFYSYAHKDELLRGELDKHLSQLRRGGHITLWHHRDINAGTDWKQQIHAHLNTAQIILLLVSPDFIDSDYCYSTEMKRALAKHKEGKTRVIPILLRPVMWDEAPFAFLQVLPQDANPVTTWPNQDLAFQHIALQIRKVVKELQINDLADQKDLTSGDNFQEPLRNKASELRVTTTLASEKASQEHTSPDLSQSLHKFRHCQEKVSELKNIHNMLHEIELQLEGLETFFKTAMWDDEQSSLASEETKPFTSDFKYIEILWRLAKSKIDDLGYFATIEMKALDDKRLSLGSEIGGASWVQELFYLRQYFEENMKSQNLKALKQYSGELLRSCRTHLYRIDKRLLGAVKELDYASDFIMRYSI